MPRLHKCYFPGFGIIFMNLHCIFSHIKSDIRIAHTVIRKILFNYISFITTTNYKIINAVKGIDFHYVPEDRFTSNFDHGFWPDTTFFADSCTKASSKYNCLHNIEGEKKGDKLLLSIKIMC